MLCIRLIVLISILVLVTVPQDSSAETNQRPLKILFIGNSYIYTNNLPAVLKTLLQAKNYDAEMEDVSNPGWTLNQHANAPTTIAKIKSQCWDYLVLQEQSVLPTFDYDRRNTMVPAILQLKKSIGQCQTKTTLFLTWGHKNGLAEAGFMNYQQMQESLIQGYYEASLLTDTLVVPVGTAWRRAYRKAPPPPLWVGDGSHPSLWGTYLSACVFFKFLTGEDPLGLPTVAGLDQKSAEVLQSIAAQE